MKKSTPILKFLSVLFMITGLAQLVFFIQESRQEKNLSGVAFILGTLMAILLIAAILMSYLRPLDKKSQVMQKIILCIMFPLLIISLGNFNVPSDLLWFARLAYNSLLFLIGLSMYFETDKKKRQNSN